MFNIDDNSSDTEPVIIPQQKRPCPRCGTAFVCGIASGYDVCWCFALPHIISLEGKGSGSASACLCPNCLHGDVTLKFNDMEKTPTENA